MSRAQDAAAHADALYTEGKRLMTAGEVANGCAKLAESQRLAPAGGTLFTLAVCRQKEGRTATAWGLFKEAAAVAVRDGRKDRATFAEERVAELAPQVAHLTIQVDAETQALPGLAIELDGIAVRAPAWGMALPADPGRHALVARAEGRREWTVSVEVPSASQVSVKVGPLLSAAPAQQNSKVEPPAAAPTGAPATTPILGYALLGVGAIGLGVSTWLVISGRSDALDSEELCPTTRCGSRSALDANSRARTKGTWGLATGVLGLASVGVGGYLVFRRGGTDVAIAPAAGASDFGVTARARW